MRRMEESTKINKTLKCTKEIEHDLINLSLNCNEILFIEPFYGGSHKQLIDTLRKYLPKSTLVSLTSKKWPWRARCGALILSRMIPEICSEKILFCSSVLNLAELLGLRPDLQKLKKIIYFHENQLVYPIKAIKERDVQYAYNQIISCLSADLVIFNSNFNRNSFLENIQKVIKLLPDYRPKNLREEIEAKSKVLYFPIDFPKQITGEKGDILHIVWPHRWEFDKGPEKFFETLIRLKCEGFKFHVSVLGEKFSEEPEIFKRAKELLNDNILNFGYLESKAHYYSILSQCHVAVSTADHEFFGVSMLEATYCGCYPLVPNRLVYPELYPEECLYQDEAALFNKLKHYCENLNLCIEDQKKLSTKLDLSQFNVEVLLPKYSLVLGSLWNKDKS